MDKYDTHVSTVYVVKSDPLGAYSFMTNFDEVMTRCDLDLRLVTGIKF